MALKKNNMEKFLTLNCNCGKNKKFNVLDNIKLSNPAPFIKA